LQKSLFIGIFLIMVALFVVACSPENYGLADIPLEKQCQVDADCVKDACCHASGAVNKDYAPDCADVLCTLSCEANTLDCGQGKISCVKGECTAVIDSPLFSDPSPS